RNSGTVGGSLAHAARAAGRPAVALALDAELVAAGPGGTRVIPAAEFFQGAYSTALAPDEILTEIRLPVWPGGHAFTEFSRVHANFAVVAVAALVELDGDSDRIRHVAQVEPRRLLVDFLREDLGLPGTHIGCEHGVCGTCTVLLDGASIRSCIVLAVQADGASIDTVEGLAQGGDMHPLQDEFSEKQGLQCGYCTP